mgnify:CR=1 FL=1
MSELQDEIEYELEKFNIGPYTFEVTTIGFIPLEVLSALSERQDGASKEVSGQKLWCGSLGVIEYLLDQSDFVRGKTVLELGAGTGVLGMLCEKLGASTVVVTDNDKRSLVHMESDVPHNKCHASVRALDWFEGLDVYAMRDMLGASVEETPDSLRIVAGDVLYKRELLEPFMNVAKKLLHFSAKSKMILCHVPRAGIEQQDIMDLAQQNDISITEIDEKLWRKGACTQHSPRDDYDRAMAYIMTV